MYNIIPDLEYADIPDPVYYLNLITDITTEDNKEGDPNYRQVRYPGSPVLKKLVYEVDPITGIFIYKYRLIYIAWNEKMIYINKWYWSSSEYGGEVRIEITEEQAKKAKAWALIQNVKL